MIAVDVERLVELTLILASLWANPLIVVGCVYFLWQQLGAASLSGLATVIATIPLHVLLAQRLRREQVKNMERKDERVKVFNKTLSGMKTIKLYSWEPCFQRVIDDKRAEELKSLESMAWTTGLQTFVINATPFIVSLCSFGTFILMDPEKNILTPEIAFVSLAYFNIMRVPITVVPTLIIKLYGQC